MKTITEAVFSSDESRWQAVVDRDEHADGAFFFAVRTTGAMLDDNPEADLELRVAVDGSEPYIVSHRQVIARAAIGGFRPGVTVPVRVDPRDPANVLVA